MDTFQLAKLPPDDMTAVNNMRLLGGSSISKKNSVGAFALKFDIYKVNLCMLVEMMLLMVGCMLCLHPHFLVIKLSEEEESC